MFKLTNGWTKATVLAQVKKYNNGTQAIDRESGSCRYQVPDGNRCAIGCFIPNGHPALAYEGGSISLLNQYPELWRLMPFESVGLGRFQSIHDTFSARGEVHQAIESFLNTEVK